MFIIRLIMTYMYYEKMIIRFTVFGVLIMYFNLFKEYCKKENWHLAIVEDSAETDFIIENVIGKICKLQ